MSRSRELAELATAYDSGGSFGFRNRIINGQMVIDQRNAGGISPSPPAGNGYLVDRFLFAGSVGSKFTGQQNQGTVTPPAGFINYQGLTSSSSYSVAAGDYFLVGQYIEGLNVADLAWGTASAATVTLSFWVRSSLTGTFGGVLSNSGSNRSYPFSYTISAANTWEQKAITIAGDTTGTWLTTNGIGIRLWFGLGVGSTYNGTAGAWAGANYLSSTGATSVVGTNGATFYITGVQLEKGSTATSFDYRPYGTELALCQRYCQVITGANYPLCTGLSYATTNCNGIVALPVTMRISPTPTYAGATDFVITNGSGGGIACTAIGNFVYSPNTLELSATVASGLTAGQASIMRTSSGGTAKITLSAEL